MDSLPLETGFLVNELNNSQQVSRQFEIRPMGVEDIEQSTEIEKEAFPTLFPYTSFEKELGNKIACYLIACESSRKSECFDSSDATMNSSWVDKVLAVLPLHGREKAIPSTETRYVFGFIGIWYMGNDAHVVTFAVRECERSMGVGESLLIAALHQAVKDCSDTLTLEVRPSNTIARNLYLKYGFEEQGLRKKYYSDNREDAIIMTSEPLNSVEFKSRFEGLIKARESSYGTVHFSLR